MTGHGPAHLVSRFSRARSETPDGSAVTPANRHGASAGPGGFVNPQWAYPWRPNQSAASGSAGALSYEESEVCSGIVPSRQNSTLCFQRNGSHRLAIAAWRTARNCRPCLEAYLKVSNCTFTLQGLLVVALLQLNGKLWRATNPGEARAVALHCGVICQPSTYLSKNTGRMSIRKLHYPVMHPLSFAPRSDQRRPPQVRQMP